MNAEPGLAEGTALSVLLFPMVNGFLLSLTKGSGT